MDVSIAQALAGHPGEGQQVTIKGWVRTRRDSKGGFSFITVNDGSCFDSIQVVAPNSLPNYANEVAKVTAGCSVITTRHRASATSESASASARVQSRSLPRTRTRSSGSSGSPSNRCVS